MKRANKMKSTRQTGFTLLETMIAMAILLAVSAIVMAGVVKSLNTQGSISNRTQMHTSVRSATEVLQQEIGQAGRVSLPNTGATGQGVTMTGPVSAGVQTPTVSSTSGMYTGMLLDVENGSNFEVVTITAIAGNTITAYFQNAHPNATIPVAVTGSFGTGVIPPTAAPASYANGSTGTVLKLYGDINRDGSVLYVEYTCVPGTQAAPGFLYRNQMSYSALLKLPVDPSKVLLNNLLPNPNNTPCFTYQVAQANGQYFVTDVAITLTVQTQNLDPVSKQYQSETKALLNVSPRNIFYIWELYSLGQVPRNQPIPANVTSLISQ